MKTDKKLMSELETNLKQEGFDIEAPTPPPVSPYCQWGGKEGCGVTSTHLSHYRIGVYAGWFCPDCAWLASLANEAVENDNS